MTTKISLLLADEEDEDLKTVNPLVSKSGFTKKENKNDIIYDRKFPKEVRAKFLEAITDDYDRSEAVSKLLSIYEFDENKAEKELLILIGSSKNNISVDQKGHIADVFYQIFTSPDCDQPNEHVADDIYAEVCSHSKQLNSTILIHCLPFMLRSPKYTKDGQQLLLEYALNENVELKNRYLSLVFLEKREKIDKEIIIPCIEALYQSKAITLEYIILTSQYLLMKGTVKCVRREIIDKLFEIGENKELDYNRRADAVDVILNTGDSEDIKKAKTLIVALGKYRNLYENKQNVHFVDISELLTAVLETKLMESDVDKVIEDIKEMTPKERKEPIERSLLRVLMDVITFGPEKKTATDILLHVWSYVLSDKNRDELLGRLLEELYDMDSTCSSGHANRLLNVVSGFNGLNVRITWEQQIFSNLEGRMLAKIKDIPDELVRAEIMTQLIDKSHDRKELNKFYIDHLPKIIDELKKEFVIDGKYITEDDFMVFTRNAMAKFEGAD